MNGKYGIVKNILKTKIIKIITYCIKVNSKDCWNLKYKVLQKTFWNAETVNWRRNPLLSTIQKLEYVSISKSKIRFFWDSNNKMEVESENRMRNPKTPFVVSVEGNIGSGKSTMLQFYSELDDVQLHPEPVEKWQNLHGHNLLEKLYTDPKRWSFQVILWMKK